MPDAFAVRPATGPAPLDVVGEQITVLAPGSELVVTRSSRQAGPEGSGPPPHRHRRSRSGMSPGHKSSGRGVIYIRTAFGNSAAK
jgi:hypothetical protein